jgi:hypothetical protein
VQFVKALTKNYFYIFFKRGQKRKAAHRHRHIGKHMQTPHGTSAAKGKQFRGFWGNPKP